MESDVASGLNQLACNRRGSARVEIEDAEHIKDNLVRFSPFFSEKDYGSISGTEAVSRAPLPGKDYSLPRSRRRRTLRSLQPLCRRLPGRLHRTSGDRG